MEHVVVHVAPGLFEVGRLIPESDLYVPTHLIRHAVHHNVGTWQVWHVESGLPIDVFRSVTDAIESVCNGDWMLHTAETRR